MEYSASHERLQLEMTLDKDALKSKEGQLCSKLQVKSSSKLVKQMKMRPRMSRPAAVRGSPYRHSYWRRYRNFLLKSSNRKLPRQ